ncbi:unnamed protein product [Rhizophagus irregularis]|nr:unnamed protein product [Rhizophagus irregularis]
MALLRLNNQGAEYDNPVIESEKPTVNISELMRKLGCCQTGQHSDSITGLCTIFSAIDILAINTLTSNLFGLKVFSALLS